MRDIKSKKILLRIDINSPVINHDIIISERFKAHARTITKLSEQEARIILLAHQGRKREKDFIPLKKHAKELSKLCKKEIRYVDDIYGKDAITAINELHDGEIILLKNTREMNIETDKIDFSKTHFVKNLSKLADMFVLDAFSVSHRAHASVVGFVGAIPCFQGPNLSNEVEKLNKLKKPKKPFIMILSGEKPEEIIMVIESFGKKAQNIILCGLVGELLWRRCGLDFGKKNKVLDNYDAMGFRKNKKIIIPKDFILENKSIATIKDLPSKLNTMDIGPQTIKLVKQKIKKSKTILMKGPLGFTEKGFTNSTKEILSAIKNTKCESIIGGGHLTTALFELGFSEKDFTHVSLGGGALIEFLSGKKLPGITLIPDKL